MMDCTLLDILQLATPVLCTFIGVIILIRVLNRSKHPFVEDSEFYTDYVKGEFIFRVYKPEFEFQATGDLDKYEIYEKGTLSTFYEWALLKKRA